MIPSKRGFCEIYSLLPLRGGGVLRWRAFWQYLRHSFYQRGKFLSRAINGLAIKGISTVWYTHEQVALSKPSFLTLINYAIRLQTKLFLGWGLGTFRGWSFLRENRLIFLYNKRNFAQHSAYYYTRTGNWRIVKSSIGEIKTPNGALSNLSKLKIIVHT